MVLGAPGGKSQHCISTPSRGSGKRLQQGQIHVESQLTQSLSGEELTLCQIQRQSRVKQKGGGCAEIREDLLLQFLFLY